MVLIFSPTANRNGEMAESLNKMEKNRTIRIMASLLGAALLMFLLAGLTPAKDAPRIWVMLGGRMPEGLIQGVTYFLFIWGIAEIVSLRMRLSREKEALAANLLPEKENYILSADDAGELKLRMQQIERTGK